MTVLKVSGVHTSTIGSFPLEDSPANRRRCIDDLLEIDIDFPTYPQLVDMCKQFLDDLAMQDQKIVTRNGRYRLIGKEIKTDVSPLGLDPFLWTLQYLEDKGVKDKVKLKAAITGPFTLASRIEIKKGSFPYNTAVSNMDLVKQLTAALVKSCQKVSKETSIISIDEPILGVIVGARTTFRCREEDIIDTYNALKKACEGKFVGTHICGRIPPNLADTLLKTELDFLSHEFHDTPVNINAYTSNKLEESGKVLSVGCVSSKNPRLEGTEEITKVMEKFRQYGDDLIFTPDCGFKNLTVDGSKEKGYEISIRKLKNMVEALKRFKARE